MRSTSSDRRTRVFDPIHTSVVARSSYLIPLNADALCTSSPELLAPHLDVLLSFLPILIRPRVAELLLTPQRILAFPLSPASPALRRGPIEDASYAEKEEVRKAALEFVVSLSEGNVKMVRKVLGWVAAIVRGCMEGMAEFDDDPHDPQSLQVWLDADVRC